MSTGEWLPAQSNLIQWARAHIPPAPRGGSPGRAVISSRTTQPWMVQVAASSPRAASPRASAPRELISSRDGSSPRFNTPRSALSLELDTARLRGTETRPFTATQVGEPSSLYPARSDASPAAFKYSPRDQSWPPREMHHYFGTHDPRAFAPHAFLAARRSVSQSPPPTPLSPRASRTASMMAESLPATPREGDVRGRRKARERIKLAPVPQYIKPLGQPPPPERGPPDVALNLVFRGLREWKAYA